MTYHIALVSRGIILAPDLQDKSHFHYEDRHQNHAFDEDGYKAAIQHAIETAPILKDQKLGFHLLYSIIPGILSNIPQEVFYPIDLSGWEIHVYLDGSNSVELTKRSEPVANQYEATPQKGMPGHCYMAQVFKNGKTFINIEPTTDNNEASQTAKLIADFLNSKPSVESTEAQTSNANKPNYFMSSNLDTKSMDKSWVMLWQQIEIWYGDPLKRETCEQLLTRLQKTFQLVESTEGESQDALWDSLMEEWHDVSLNHSSLHILPYLKSKFTITRKQS